MNAQQITSAALRVIGSLASGETPTNAEAQDALSILNMQMDSWNAERLAIFTVASQAFTFTPNQQAYTVGAGANFNIPRPPRIEKISTILLTNPAQPLELPLQMLTFEQWQQVPVKAVPSTIPTMVYDDGGFPYRTLSFWPIPTQANQAVLYFWTALTQFADLVTDYTFPPGYFEAIKYQLAMRLYPEFGRPVDPAIERIAIEALERIKSFNVPILPLGVDPALQSRGGFYDYRSDTYR